MKLATMRRVDRWLGVPVCWLLTFIRKLSRSRPPAEPPRRILFVKLAEQGSTVLASAAIKAATDLVGREQVYFALFEENRAILDLMDVVPRENVVAIRARGLFGAIASAAGALIRLRRANIDTAIDLEFFARSSAAIAYLSGAKRRVGFNAFGGEAPYRGDLFTHRVPFNPYLHTTKAFLILVHALGQPPDRFPTFPLTADTLDAPHPRFQPTIEDLEATRTLWPAAWGAKASGRAVVLLNANASDLAPLRRWPNDRYVELARRLLARDPNLLIGLTGAPEETSSVMAIERQIGSERCVCLAGKTTIRQLLTAYCLSDVLVTNDSGPAHFASMTTIDVVVLFGPETPLLFAAPTPNTHPLWARLACSPCVNAFNNRSTACVDNACMQAITIDQVEESVVTLLAGRRSRRGEPSAV